MKAYIKPELEIVSLMAEEEITMDGEIGEVGGNTGLGSAPSDW